MRSIYLVILISPLAAPAALAQTTFRTDNHNVALSCTPSFATSHDYADPIKSIRVQLTPNSARIVHEAQSGRAYDRTEQYLQSSAHWKGDNFIWRGVRSSNPRIAMTGVVELGPNGYTYRESQFDAGLGGRKTYDMVSLCKTVAELPEGRSFSVPTPPSSPRPPLAPPPPLAAEKQRMVEIMNERLVACAEPKLSELAKSGEMAATLTDATLSVCREAVDDLISARIIQNGSPANKDTLRAAIRTDLISLAVQTLADLKRDAR